MAKKVWKCDFCFEVYAKKGKTVVHEKNCSSNPENKECFTCASKVGQWHEGQFSSKCTKGFNIFSDSDTCNSWILKMEEHDNEKTR